MLRKKIYKVFGILMALMLVAGCGAAAEETA